MYPLHVSQTTLKYLMISCVHGVPPSPEEGVNIQVELWISSIHEYGDQPVGVLQNWPLEHLTVAIPACSHDRVLIPLNRDNVDQEFRMDKADVSIKMEFSKNNHI